MGLGLGKIFKTYVSTGWDQLTESYGGKGHTKIGEGAGKMLNNFTGQTDAFERSNAAEWAFWNANNAYNSPKAQMERYAEAGLNPNLIYGSGSASAGNASGSAPSMSAAGAGALSAVLSLYNMKAQNSLLKSQIALTNANAKVAKENADNTMTTNLLNGRKANLLYYQDKYAEAEYKQFLQTGKIPESYLKSNWSSELTGLLKGVISKYLFGS